MPDDDFMLLATPPRPSGRVVPRPRLAGASAGVRRRTGTLVEAPPGFGKTTLLAHWRRDWVAEDVLVAWYSADPHDDAARFHAGLVQSIRIAGGLSPSVAWSVQSAAGVERPIQALTLLLDEVARNGRETVIVIDDADALHGTSLSSLAYLFHNAPANLHLVLASASPLRERLGLPAHGGFETALREDDLRFDLEETTRLAANRAGAALVEADALRLHDALAGWPLGLQLALLAVSRPADGAATLAGLRGRIAGSGASSLAALLDWLPEDLVAFAEAISLIGHVTVPMCQEVFASEAAGLRLYQLLHDTPLVVASGPPGWFRVPDALRRELQRRARARPEPVRKEWHLRAARWFAREQRFESAFQHALAAGDLPLANAHATEALWRLRRHGRFAHARALIARIPAMSLATDARLRMVAAWATSYGENHAVAFATAGGVLADRAADPATAFLAALIQLGATRYSDRIGHVPGLFERWPAFPAGIEDPACRIGYDNALANLQLHRGQTAALRETLAAPARGEGTVGYWYRTMLVAMSHLWDGDPIAAENVARPGLTACEQATGRRSMASVLLAVVCAAAAGRRDRIADAQALLEDRFDVIERVGLADVLLLGFTALVRVALAGGDTARALALLDRLEALATRRDLPRLAMHSLADRIRILAGSGYLLRTEVPLQRLAALSAVFDRPDYLPYRTMYALQAALAGAYVDLAGGDDAAARRRLDRAEACASELGRREELAIILGLRALIAHRAGDADAPAALAKVRDAMWRRGDARTVIDAHPQLARLLRESTVAAVAPPPATPAATMPAQPVQRGQGLLTPKESEILELLGERLDNRRIAQRLEIRCETVKWHLKNLFQKLSAANRSHAVERARLLGLLAVEPGETGPEPGSAAT